MNKPVNISELQASATMLEKFLGRVEVMDRTAKLRRWASLCREHEYPLVLYHNLEYWYQDQLRATPVTSLPGISAMTLAVNDPTFQKLGLSEKATIKGLMDFFEISQQQLHTFSCDCGGHVYNTEQARRIEGLIK